MQLANSEDEGFFYTQADIDAYAESLTFVEWMIALDNDSDSFATAMSVRRMQPTIGL